METMRDETIRAETIRGDTLIIGGGSAGCALAARLSADPNRQVILLESGPKNRSPILQLTAGKIIRRRPVCDWGYFTEPDPNMANRPRYWPRGRLLGGSSAVNGLLANRGHHADYDGWHALGCTGWSWNDVLPYFLRLEDFGPVAARHDAKLHHRGGPLPVSSPRGRHFLCEKFVTATQEIFGTGANPDFSGDAEEGAGYYAVNASRGLIPMRVSAADAYLKHARRRSNLRIITNAHVRRINFDGRRATGAEFDHDGVRTTVIVRRQVILSTGTIGSPQLLQQSGIGDPDHLRSLGISVVLPLTAVGENLQDHLQLPSRFRFNAHTFGEKMHNVYRRLLLACSGLIVGTGSTYGTTNFGIFARTDPKLPQPDTQFHVHPSGGSLILPDRFSSLTIAGWQLQPTSRGRIRLRSAEPGAPPAIFANYLSTDVDQQAAITILRLTRRMSEHAALRPYIVDELTPGRALQSDAELLDFARQTGETTYHPAGTCRMGADPESVVDPRLRVRGIERLYVADASIMPTVISGNPNVPSVMIGEKAADMIIEDERGSAAQT
jgi:choline dehydrogenase